jgi:hypothetical protein
MRPDEGVLDKRGDALGKMGYVRHLQDWVSGWMLKAGR